MSQIPEKYYVEIHANGDFNEEILGMITNHNEGKGEIEGFETLIHYMKAKRCLRSNSCYQFEVTVMALNKKLLISEKGKPTLTISYNQFK